MANRFLYLARHGEAVDDGALSPTGERQARLLGERLARVPLASIRHSPLPRATRTARLVAESVPGAVPRADEALGDYFPPVGDPGELPQPYARFLAGVPADELAAGARLAAVALERYAMSAATDTHELVVTHNFQVAWFVRHALGAPDPRWLGLNAGNCSLTVILYRPDRPPTLVSYNDMSHLPARLRWTGFPAELVPGAGTVDT